MKNIQPKQNSVALSTDLFQDILCLPSKPLQIDLDHRVEKITITVDVDGKDQKEQVLEWSNNFGQIYEHKIREEIATRDKYRVSIMEAIYSCILSQNKAYIAVGHTMSQIRQTVIDILRKQDLTNFIINSIQDYTINSTQDYTRFSSGSKLVFFSIQDNFDKLRGLSLDGYSVEEGIILNQDCLWVLNAMCVRANT